MLLTFLAVGLFLRAPSLVVQQYKPVEANLDPTKCKMRWLPIETRFW
jgi:hypothetical protein